MELIVAVYDDWGIGCGGTQPVALSADRKFFRETTKGACVIVGRKTLADFPGGRPLPNRVNVVISRTAQAIEGTIVCKDIQEAAQIAAQHPKAMVIGGGSVYRQMLPMCSRAYVTKVHASPLSDTFFPNLDEAPDWRLAQVLKSGEEDGIAYEICVYERTAKSSC